MKKEPRKAKSDSENDWEIERTPRQPVIRVAKLLRRQPPTPRPHALKQPVEVTQLRDDFAREAWLVTMCEWLSAARAAQNKHSMFP